MEKCSTLLGDNNSVIVNTQLPSSSIKKKHNSVAFHKAREAVTAGLTGPILYNNTGVTGFYTVCDTNVLMIMSLTMLKGSSGHR